MMVETVFFVVVFAYLAVAIPLLFLGQEDFLRCDQVCVDSNFGGAVGIMRVGALTRCECVRGLDRKYGYILVDSNFDVIEVVLK